MPIIKSVKGPEIYALTEPVIPNTMKIITIWKLDVIPHLSLSFFIIILKCHLFYQLIQYLFCLEPH